MGERVAACDDAVARARLARAEEFGAVALDALDLAEHQDDVANAAVTLFVHAGIAAADVICCTRLRVFSQGEDHRQAVDLLGRADVASARHLRVLLALKTRAGYSHVRLGADELKRAARAADALLVRARELC